MKATPEKGGKANGPTPALFAAPPSSRAREARTEAPGRVLACLEDSAFGDTVLQHALAVARGLDLTVTAARVIETAHQFNRPADPIEWQIRRHEGRRRLDHLVAARAPGAAGIESVLLAGAAADELTGWAKDHQVTLMALGTHERREDEAGLGATAQKLLERAPASLLLVPMSRRFRPKLPYQRLLVPLDGSYRAESVLPIAVRIARAHGAELILAHAVPPFAIAGFGSSEKEATELCSQLAQQNETGAREYLDGFQTQFWKERLPVRSIVAANGDPRTKLRQLAINQHVDLIVVASHGRSGMADVPCGSVTEYLATHAPAPLLIVRPNFAHVFSDKPGAGSDDIRPLSVEHV